MLSAVLALTAVAVADRVEQRLVAPATDAAVTSADAPEIAAAPAPLTSPTPLTSAALPAGEMVLTFADGSAAISTGANDPIFELGTTTIGDLDLSGAEPVLAQGDGEVSADWGDVTEWYRAAGDGIEHGYTVDSPVSAGDDLTITVDVVDGEPSLVDGQTVAIERAEGGIVWYRGLFAFDANGTDLPAEMAVVDGDIELRIDIVGAEYPITIDPTITDEQELLAWTPEELGYFGSVGAIDEARGRMIVGGGTTATIFELQGGGWTRVQELLPANPGPPPPGMGNQVVTSVDISGDIAVIGSISFGTVAIYDRDAGGFWELSQTLATGDAGFGAAVGVGDGVNVDFIMTGAPEAPWTGTPDPGPNGGQLREYTRTVDGFVESSNGLGTEADSFQGAAVDVEHLGGDDFSYGWTLTGGINWVIVNTISWNGSSFDETGQRVARFSDAGLAPGSGFGGDLDIEGTGFVVGADAASGAFVYDFDGPVARVGFAPEIFPTAALVPSSGTGLLSVARGTETIAVGASTAAGGTVELFDYSPISQTWSTTGESFQPAGYTSVVGGEYGKFVALSGRVLATGDPLADGAFIDQGRAFTADLAGSLVVTDTGDAPDTAAGDGVCDTGAGACTLRAAIEEANALPGSDTIEFDILGVGPHLITAPTGLPPITDTVTIDGFTQAGSAANTNPAGATNAVAQIQLVGDGAGSGDFGIDLSGSTGSVVRGLAIGSFEAAIKAGPQSVIAGNYIGSVGGLVERSNNYGVLIESVDQVDVGGIAPADKNVISGNRVGVYVTRDADDNDIINNLIGTDRFGAAAVPNEWGISIEPSEFGAVDNEIRNDNRIGNGSLSGRNIISGNLLEGIALWGNTDGTVIRNNFVGVAANGSTPLGNSQAGPDTGAVNGDGGFNWGGIVLRNGASNTVIGGLAPQGNIIANNNNGVVVFSGTGNQLVGNAIFDNRDRGILLLGAGVNDPGDADEGANRGQNQPVITDASIDGADASVEFSIDTPDTPGVYPMVVEFFEADSGTSGEGRRTLRRESVAGPGSYARVLGLAGALQFSDGDAIVATATDASGNTSSFSNVAIVGGSDRFASSVVGERFGQSIDIDGNRMAVGAPFADLGDDNAGAVYVYDRTSDGAPWVLTATITSPEPELDGGFGDAVDIRGDRIAIGESDRLGDSQEEGRVWVFQRGANGLWSQLGGWIEASGLADGNQFGASIAWIDDNRLAIGAPGAPSSTGEVWVAEFVGGETGWLAFELSTTNTISQSVDDRLGFSVAFDDSSPGNGTLVAGAPGASRRYEWTIDGGPIGNPGVATYTESWNMGSAVDVSGNRVVVGGYSDELRVAVAEISPQRANTTQLGAVLPSGAGLGPINDYLDIEGRNVAVSRGGDGGRVELYRIDDGNLLLTDPVLYEPAVVAGDRLGWAIDLQGRTLVAGAPGTNADAGALFSTDVGVTATWTGAAVGNSFTDPGNWDLGVVPGPGDVAVIPSGVLGVTVDADAEVGRLELDNSTVSVLGPVQLVSSSTSLRNNGEIFVGENAELVLRNDVLLDGFIVVTDFGSEGSLVLDGDVTVTGDGELDLLGDLNKIGSGAATIDIGDATDLNAGVRTGSATNIALLDGALTLTGADLRQVAGPAGFAGEAFVAAGAELLVTGDLVLTDQSSIGVDIDGDALSPVNFGRITVTGTLFKDGGLFANVNVPPAGSDQYDIITCSDCTPGLFATTSVDPLVVTTGPTSVTLALPAVDPTFTNLTPGAAWGDSANWSTGVVPGPTDAAIIPDGANVTVFGPGTTSVGSLTLAGNLDADPFGTGLRFEILGDSVIEASGSLFVTGSLDSSTPYTNTLALSGVLQVDGSFGAQGQILLSGSTILARSTPVIELNDGASFSGDGSVFLGAQFVKNDPGTVTFGPDLDVDLDFDVDSTLEVNVGTLDIQSAGPNGSFVGDGTIAIGPGATVELPSGTALGADSVVDIGIAGSSSNAANYGRLLLPDGASAGTLSTTFTSIPAYTPNLFDRYPVVDCGDSTCAPFPTAALGGLDQVVVAGDIVLGVSSANPTFINASGDGRWGTAANWSTGVVPGADDTAVIPAGVTALVLGGFDVGALDVAGQVEIDQASTLNVTGGSAGTLPTTVRSTGSLTVISPDTLNIAAESVVIEAGGVLAVGTDARLVFTGDAAQTVTGAGQFLNDGILRNQNPQSVTMAATVDYVDGSDSRIEAVVGEFRFGPSNLGLTDVDIENGATFEFSAASATAGGNFEVRGTLQSQSLDVSGIVQVRAGGLFVPDGTLDIEGGQVVTAELAPRGEIQLLDGASITGTGLVANSGDVVTTGAVTIGSGVTWNSGRNSLVVVNGTLDVQTTNFDAQGSISVESGTITFAGNTILRPSSSLTFSIAADGAAGTISTQQLGFEPFPSSGPGPDPDPDQTLARIELDIDEAFTGAGPITIFTCTDCAADPPGIANGVEFDEFVTGEFDVIVGRNTVDVAILDNKNRSAAGGTGFGSSVSVDGDRAVVGSSDGVTGPVVLERNGDAWDVVQELSNSSSVKVTLNGDAFIADGILYEIDAETAQFDAMTVIGGTSFDLDGELALLGDNGATAEVFVRSDFVTALAVLEPATIPASYGADVALLDLGGGSALAAVSAPDTGEVYIFERVAGAWSESEVRTLTSPDGGGNRFGQSISISESALIVGEPLNDGPGTDGGAAWVYPLDGIAVADTPVRLTPSAIEAADQFGSDVSIDSNVIVVGASVAQKFNFPIRDGAAFVFQFDGIDWVETDALRAPDAFSFELFGDAVAVSGTDVLVGARRDRNSNGAEAGAVYDFAVEPIEPAVTTSLELALSSGSTGSESVVGSISIADLDRVASAGVNAGSTLAAASLVDIAGDDPQATALSQISLGATPLTSIVIGSDELSAIPLVNISIDGGWGDVIAGSELENEPFASLTFGQVIRSAGVGNSPQAPSPDSPAGKLAQTPLTSIEVDGTPLTSIPLGAIALGETPLTSIDGPDWCSIVAELIPDGVSCESAIAELTLFEVTLRGVPLTSIPLTSIPLTSIDLADSPLTSIPLTSIDLGATPLTSIPLTSINVAGSPLTSIPLTSIPLTSIPLTSIPLTSIPLTSIPLTSIPLTSIATSIPLTSIPLTSIGPNGTPLTSIQLQGAPLTSIPLTSIVLADTPLTSIPLTSIGNDDAWCEVLAAAGTGFDCTAGADPATTTLRDLSVRGVPLTSIPLTSIPLTSIQLQGAPLTSIPLTSIPLTSIPLTSIPLTSIPLTSIDLAGAPLTSILLTSIPLTSIDLGATPLTSIPLTSIPLTSIPLTSIPLTSIPLTSIPLTSIPLTSIRLGGTPLTSIPLTSIDIVNTPLTSIPLTSIPLTSIDCRAVDCSRDSLGDAARAGAISDALTLADIRGATSGIRLGEIVDALAGVDRNQIIAALAAEGLTLDDLDGFDDLQLGELPLDLLGGVTLGDLGAALATVTFGDLVGAIVDPATGRPFPQLEEDLRAGIANEAITIGDLDSLGDVTLGDLLDGATAELTLADIEPILGFITVQTFVDAGVIDLDQIDFGTAELGDLTADQLGQLTLGDVLAQAGGNLGPLLDALDAELANYTLGDLLLALVDPGSLSLGGVDFPDVAAATLPDGTSPTTTFVARFTATGNGPQLVDVRAELPAGASLRPGTARVIEDPDVLGPRIETLLEPTVSGSSLIWTVTALPGVPYAIEFDVTLGLRLGVASLTSTARVLGTDVVQTASTELSIIEGAENNDFPQVTAAEEGFVYLTYIASTTDNDVYSIVLEENDRLFVELSNLDADLDLALYADPDDVRSGSPLTGGVSSDAPLNAVTDPDADGADAEPLDDFRRLDQLDGDLELIAVSNQAGDENEGLATGRLAAGTYYIQVYGANGATNLRPAALQLQVAEADDAPVCQPVGVLPSANFGTLPTIGPDVNTLILVNESRLEQFYGAAARSDVSTSLAGLTGFLAGDPTIVPAVVPVDGSAGVRAAYQAWDTDSSCDSEIANDVVRAINDEIIDDVRDQLDHVVILGGDDIIPMARLVDSTKVANEYDFRNEFDGDLVGDTDAQRNGRNALTSSFWDSRILSDEPYGDADARSLGDRYLYVTDIALGRVVETPEDIVDALDTFVEFDGNLAIETATVLGYDFLVDGSEAVADALIDGLGDPGLVDATLADGIDDTGELWDRVDAAEKLVAAGSNALVSLNAHFDHYRALPAIGDKVPGFEDNLIAEDVAEELTDRLGDRALLNSLIFSMGCHSGLSVSDITIAGTNTDWAETLGQQGALYVGNTGFGYGDTETVAYTELLMALFAEQVTAPLDLDRGAGLDVSTVGQALAWAKNEYVSGVQTFSVYDEKALMESTFYGLPFYRVGLESEPLPDPPTNQVQDGQLVVNIDTDFGPPAETPSGTLFVDTLAGKDSLIVAPGRPIQPKAVVDVSDVDPVDPRRLATVAHGAIIESMTSEYDTGVDPVIATPIFDEAAGQPEPDVGDVVFPTRPLDITTSVGPAGKRQQLVVATGQFNSERSTQRLDDEHRISVYYSNSDDFTAPAIGAVTSSVTAGVLNIDVSVSDSASTVVRVVALVAQNPGFGSVTWSVLPLANSSGRWSGSLALERQTTDVEFIIQALDGAGNVGFASNKAENFGDVASAGGPVTPPIGGDLEVDVVGATGPIPGVFNGSASITVSASATPIEYSINGRPLVALPSGESSFTISEPGRNTWRVVTSTGQTTMGAVEIDTDGAPRIEIRTPAEGAVLPANTPRRFDAICRDDTRERCALTLTGPIVGGTGPARAVANGSTLPQTPGVYRLSVRGTDRLGNETRLERVFTIARTVGAPTIKSIAGPTEPQRIDVPVEIVTTFADPSGTSDDYELIVDWGDETAPEVIAVAPGSEPTGSLAAAVSASRVYSSPGVYSIGVTVRDDAGGEAVGKYEFVVVFDPDTRGRVSGQGFYWSGPEAHAGSPWFGSPAFFGYNARYRNGSDVPSGKTKLKLVGEFLFESTQYDYLIVNDTLAVAEGTGTTGRNTSYRFRVQGIDNGKVDFFQITIWDDSTGDVLYDNGVVYTTGGLVEDDRGDRVLLGGIRVKS